MSIATHNERVPRLDPADPMPAEIRALRDGTGPVWIFAYGSLIWEPEFDYAEAAPALLRGYHRSFCLYSYDYRGSRERPGLVLGLDRGGSCRGMAFRLMPDRLAQSLDRVWAREMTAPRVYDLRHLPMRIARGSAAALAFTVRRDRPDYAGRLPLDETARLIAGAAGSRGACRDYLDNTVRHLAAFGIADAPLSRLAVLVRELAAGAR